MGGYIERLQGIMAKYAEELEKANQHRRPGSGIFGFGHGPGDDPCHETMDKQVGELTAQIMTENGEPEEMVLLVTAILQAEKGRDWSNAAKWAVLAIQRYTIPLISKINTDDRKKIVAWYSQAYPRRMRLPIQRQIIKELEK